MMEPNGNKKELHISKDQVEAFGGRKSIELIFKELLAELKELNFVEYLNLPKGGNVRHKHLIVGVVKRMLELAKEKQFNLAQMQGSIYMFNGCYWQPIDKEELKSLLSSAAIAMGVPHYDAIHFDFKKKLLEQFLTDGHTRQLPKSKNSIMINLQNGTYQFNPDGGRLRSFDPQDFLTNQLPFEYNESAKCPQFDQFLLKVLPDESCRLVLQEYIGYIFSNQNLEKIMILTGNGSNGKSVFFNIICALIGKDNILNYSIGLFDKEYNRAQLKDKLLNFSSEKGSDLDPDTLKLLISREPIQARELYKESFNLCIITKFIMNANDLPKITEHTDAFFRRQIIIPFLVKITEDEKDIHLAEKIIASELSGIFNWALEGLQRLLRQQAFTYSETIEAAVNEYRKQSDTVALFIDEKNLITSTNKSAVADLYKEYKNFCLDDGYKAVGKNKFSTRLTALGFEATRLTGGAAAFFIETDYSRG